MKLDYFFLIILISGVDESSSSKGDSNPFYFKCINKCGNSHCDEDGVTFLEQYSNPFYLSVMQWNCFDECKYDCMWKTVDQLEKSKQDIPQFYGKWPFIRIFGIQEPASTVFSICNLIMHLRSIKTFREYVSLDSPLFWLWHVYSLVCSHAWLWSAVFHARDLPFTEIMDYAGAFSIVLVTCYCMIIRVFRNLSRFFLAIITTFFFAFYINHVMYLLNFERIDYKYNMELNLITGSFTAISWFAWCMWNRLKQPYVWKCAIFVALTGLVTLLEVVDTPPIFYIFDSHSLWHLSTAFLVYSFYSFAMDDCRYLKKQEIRNSFREENKIKPS